MRLHKKILEDLKGCVINLKGAKGVLDEQNGGYWKDNNYIQLVQVVGRECLTQQQLFLFLYLFFMLQHSPYTCIPTCSILSGLSIILCKVLEAKPHSSKLDIRWQFEKLLQEPIFFLPIMLVGPKAYVERHLRISAHV